MLETLPYLCFVALTIEQLSKRGEGGGETKDGVGWEAIGVVEGHCPDMTVGSLYFY